MAEPTRYDPAYDFSDFQASNPGDPLPGDKVDIELAALQITTDETIDNLGLIQRDDGELANQSVHPDALTTATRALIVAGGNPRGDWATATAYAVGDIVENISVYICLVAHTSGTFSTDLSTGKWMLLSYANALSETAYFERFSGTGSAQNITLSQAFGTDEQEVEVYVDGLRLDPTGDYTLSGTTLSGTFASGTNNILVFAPDTASAAAALAAQAAQAAAETAETNAETAEANAEAAATAAQAAQTAAETAETNAETAETNAETAATAAQAAQTAAELAETNAETAETGALAAQTAAEAAQTAAEAAVDTINLQGVPAGGTTGQILAKASATDYDTEWVEDAGGLPDIVGQTEEATPSGSDVVLIQEAVGSAYRKVQLDNLPGGGSGGLASLVDDTSPQLGGDLDYNGNQIVDASGNEVLGFGSVASAVNYVQLTNAATGGGAIVEAEGDDTNVDLVLRGKGSGAVAVTGNITVTGTVDGRDVATDGTKLDGIASGAEVNTVDSVNSQTGAVVLDADDIDDAATTNKFTTAGDISKLAGIEAAADVTDAANVDAAGAVMESDFNAQTILAATADNTPAAVTVGEAQLVGRATGGNVGALTAAQGRTLLGVLPAQAVSQATYDGLTPDSGTLYFITD